MPDQIIVKSIEGTAAILFAVGLLAYAYIRLNENISGLFRRKKKETEINGWLKEFIMRFPYPAFIKQVVKRDDGSTEFRMQYVNPAYEEWFGVRDEDYRGKTDFEVWPVEIAREYYAGDSTVYVSKSTLQLSEAIHKERHELIPNFFGTHLTFRKFYVEKDGIEGIVGFVEEKQSAPKGTPN